MASRDKYSLKKQGDTKGIPFTGAEEAWFWFVQAQAARADGARFAAGLSSVPRPCEPIDIMRIVDRLYRQRCLIRDHLQVLRHYGMRNLAPDPFRRREARAHTIWTEALARMEVVMIRKGIVRRDAWKPNPGWAREAVLLDGGLRS